MPVQCRPVSPQVSTYLYSQSEENLVRNEITGKTIMKRKVKQYIELSPVHAFTGTTLYICVFTLFFSGLG